MAKAACAVLIVLVLFACRGSPIAAITVAKALRGHTYNVRLAESSAPGNWTGQRQEDGRILSHTEEPTLTYSANGGSVNFVKRQLVENVVAWTDRSYRYTGIAASGIPVGSTFWAGPVAVYPGSNKKVTLTTPIAIEFYFWSELRGGNRHGGWPSLYPQYATGSILRWNLEVESVYKMDVGAGQSVDISINTNHFVGGFAYSVIPTASPTGSPTSSPTSSPSPAPTQTPTASPTGSPTSSPTSSPSPAPTLPTSAKGDPHLVNMHGQRFDLYQTGVHVLIQVPWQAKPADSLLRVEAEARRLGGACAELYFQVVNITGSWTAESGGLQFFANVELDRDGYWRHFGDVDLKVVRGHTVNGIAYLNVLVKRLSGVKLPVGGLLGEDDHSAAMTPPPDCGEIVDLHRAHRASFAMVEG